MISVVGGIEIYLVGFIVALFVLLFVSTNPGRQTPNGAGGNITADIATTDLGPTTTAAPSFFTAVEGQTAIMTQQNQRNSLDTFIVQADGKIILGGSDQDVADTVVPFYRRYNADFTVDNTFPIFNTFLNITAINGDAVKYACVNCIKADSSGNVYALLQYTGISSNITQIIIRKTDTDGNPDASWNLSTYGDGFSEIFEYPNPLEQSPLTCYKLVISEGVGIISIFGYNPYQDNTGSFYSVNYTLSTGAAIAASSSPFTTDLYPVEMTGVDWAIYGTDNAGAMSMSTNQNGQCQILPYVRLGAPEYYYDNGFSIIETGFNATKVLCAAVGETAVGAFFSPSPTPTVYLKKYERDSGTQEPIPVTAFGTGGLVTYEYPNMEDITGFSLVGTTLLLIFRTSVDNAIGYTRFDATTGDLIDTMEYTVGSSGVVVAGTMLPTNVVAGEYVWPVCEVNSSFLPYPKYQGNSPMGTLYFAKVTLVA